MKGRPKPDYEELAQQINSQIKCVKDDGTIETKGPVLYFDLVTVLVSLHNFPQQIPNGEKVFIVKNAVSELAKKGVLTGENLQKQLKRWCSQFLRRPKQKFTLLTSLPIKANFSPRPIREGKNTVSFATSMPASMSLAQFEERFQWGQIEPHPEDFMFVKIACRARTERIAEEKAMNSLDYLRGIWNLKLNPSWRFLSHPEEHPINKVHCGPVHTVHGPDGKPSGDIFWYEIARPKNPKAVDLSGKWKKMRKWERRVRQSLRGHPFAEELRLNLVRYARALDELDSETTFLKLWTILEHLTASVGNYDMLIRRASFIYDEHNLMRQVLEHLRTHRNSLVHADRASERYEDLVLQLKRIVEQVLHKGLFFGRQFPSLSAFGEFLDLPKDHTQLRHRIAVAEEALRFREGRKRG